MQFFYDSPEAYARAAEHIEKYKDVTYACTLCRSTKTVETDELVPSGIHFKVLCENGHLSNGYPYLDAISANH